MGEEAMSPVIGTVLIMAMMVTIVGTMLAWGIPQIQDNEAWAQYATTRSNLLNLDADLDQVLLQGEGASRSTTVSIGLGTFVWRHARFLLVTPRSDWQTCRRTSMCSTSRSAILTVAAGAAAASRAC